MATWGNDTVVCLLFPFVFLVILVTLYLARLRKVKQDKRCSRTNPASIMIIVGSGGHTKEILTLMKGLGPHYSPRFYVIANTDTMSEDKVKEYESSNQTDHQHETYSIHKIPRSREVKQSWVTTVISTAVAILYSFPLVFKLRPEIILCNGPGTCIPLCFAGLMLKFTRFGKTQIIYVESICRVQTLSLSAKILYYLADDIFVQWPSLQRLYPRTKYIGRLV